MREVEGKKREKRKERKREREKKRNGKFSKPEKKLG
jgi:hypothetical protein